jgi:hypothetical protein
MERQPKRRVIFEIKRFRGCSMFEQLRNSFTMARLRSIVQRGRSTGVSQPEIGALVQEQSHNFNVVSHCGQMKRSSPVVLPPVYVPAVHQQDVDDFR